MSAISAMSARYSQSDSDPEESSFFFPSSSSSSTSISTSASAYEFGVEAGIIPSATMLSTPFPIEAPAQHSSIPFVSAHARIAEFEQLREELRKTDIAREMQVERLNALVFQASYELPAVPQFGGSMMPTASIHGSQTGYHVVPERIPAVCHPIGDPFLPQFNQFDNYQQACALSAPMPTPMPTSSMVTPMPIQHLHYQPQQLLHATVTGVASPGFVTRGRVTKACEYCKFRKVKCSGGEPCERCTERAIQCVYERRKPRGPAKKRSEMRDVPVQQVSVSSASSMPRQIFDAPPAFSVAIPSHPHPRPSAIIPPPPLPSSASMRPTLLSSVPSLSRPLFSPPTPATPTLVNASGQVITPTASTFPQFDVAKPLPSANLEPSSTKSPRSSPEESAVSPIKPSSPERFSDEEILMTLKMPSDPSGTPSGFFDFLDPSQEASFPDEVEALSEKTPNLGSITDFETHLDPSRKMPGGEVVDKIRKKEPAEVKTLIMLAPPVVKRAPSMPTIVEEDEEEEEDGDVTITPTVAQRAFLPPDKFARPRSEPQTVAPAKVSEDPEDDSLETPRPRAQESTFSVPAPDPFDAIFSLETSFGDPDNFTSQFDFSSTAGEQSAKSDFDALFDVDIPAWNEAVFGEPSSQESTPSSSSSLWELTSKEELSMETGADIDTSLWFEFPSPNVGANGNEAGMLTNEDFLKAVIEAAQSTPKAPVQHGFEFFSDDFTF